jgi:protein phosphatase 2C
MRTHSYTHTLNTRTHNMHTQEAISLAMRCSTRVWEKGASRKAAVRIAASVLTKAAVDRGSRDNVSGDCET